MINPTLLSYGTFVTTDLKRARAFYQDFLGLECVRYKSDAMLVRDRGTHPAGRLNGNPYWVLNIQRVDKVDHPQNVLNHWGVDMASREEVDRAHAMAIKYKDAFGIRKIMQPKVQHDSYSFYFQEYDSNFWEITARTAERSAAAVRARGDIV